MFEQNIDLIRSSIQISITSAIDYWLPYIRVNEVSVDFPSLNDNVITSDIMHVILIKLFFSVGNENINRSISFSINDNGQLGIVTNE